MDKPFRNQFKIRDLENMSGIKAHTIRIWEQRYGIFSPSRAGNNIRFYSADDLRKWLNVSSLYHLGYKISAIAQMSDDDLIRNVRKECQDDLPPPVAFQSFILAMLTFDTRLFHRTFHDLLKKHAFESVYTLHLLPLLTQIGLMWQTESVTIAHEHFLSNLIRQKILAEVEKAQSLPSAGPNRVYVLFLPENEIHELALLFAHYTLCRQGFHSIYLGQSVPLASLADLRMSYEAITYISSFTVEPDDALLIPYLREASHTLLRAGQDELRVSGRKIQGLKNRPAIPGIRYLLPGDSVLSK